MGAPPTDSALVAVTDTVPNAELHKAWYLLALLLRIGRRAPPAELASKCILFRAPTDYIRYLCSLPNSPICLTADLFVTPSLVAFVAFRNFVTNSIAVDAFVPLVELGVVGARRVWEDVARTYYRRRKRVGSEFEAMQVRKRRGVLLSFVENEDNRIVPISPTGAQSDSNKLQFPLGDYVTRGTGVQATDISTMTFNLDNFGQSVGQAPFSVKLNSRPWSYGLKTIDFASSKETSISEYMKEHQRMYTLEYQQSFLNLGEFSHIHYPIAMQTISACVPHRKQSFLTAPIENSDVCGEIKMREMSFESRISLNGLRCTEAEEHSINPPVEAENVGLVSRVENVEIIEDKPVFIDQDEDLLVDSICCEGETQYVGPAASTSQMVMSVDAKRMNTIRCPDTIESLSREIMTENVESKVTPSVSKISEYPNQLVTSSAKSKTSQTYALNPKQEAFSKALHDSKPVDSPTKKLQCTSNKNSILMKQKLKQQCDQKMHNKKNREIDKEKRGKPIAVMLEKQQESKPLPNFECFTVEEEEGSGGYGTVYRAQRNGVKFAIKCPHANANRHHVYNELKMLERFGGKSFVIKYEGSFKCGSSECLVLEHVEHDRPEVLKREIDVSQLQWYGYCMFRALASLHKQEVVHRDVKPGNFLFSRRVNKGYLIDFNLAMDLHKKYGTTEKSKTGCDLNLNHDPILRAKALPPTHHKFEVGKSFEAINQETGKGSKSVLLPKNLKRKALDPTNTFPDLDSRNMTKSQGADGSGITSAKDATSTRTPSGERMRQPIICQGRKEYISLAKAIHSPHFEAPSVPASKRKRIAALPGKVDKKLVYLTPMPLFSTGVAVAGAGLVNDKGDGKQRKEGPCVGTKGFRAPEVLLKSAHQGPKVDIWSAGVTLLYLMIGRTPFTGEPEQNIKEIAKLRGSEDMWEVAKLHSRESSFPPDLHDVKFMQSTKLREWCKQNTRRPDFLEAIPRSLFDLVDKCLTVNPRLRISAEEALRHEFFAPCHESLRKVRLVRQEVGSEMGAARLRHRQPQTCEGVS
ncbi:uncharacterized protein LOC127813922 [Diospyros lotus]|uniref:uncharacterized protein LOC127813922 n=1 Tax=Diospyros lotus TaxID=55363 RepID=UPI002253F75B|nr:uncharacterized protein LOC127813922 [Diospyros lotus]